MNVMKMVLRNLILCLAAVALVACGGAEERKAEHMKKAQSLYSEGSYEKARIEFKNVLQIDPKDVAARYALAQTMEKLQDWRAAVAQYRGVIELDPGHIDARVRLAQIYMLGNATDLAKQMVDAVLEKDPTNADALVIRGGLKARSGDTDGAVQDANLVLEKDPTNSQALALMSSLSVKAGDLVKAAGLLEKGVDAHPDNVALRVALASVYGRQGDPDKAAKQLQEIIRLQPDEVRNRIRLAAFYASLKRTDEAEKVLREAIAHDPENVTAKLALVQFLANQAGDKERAEEELKRFVEESPESYELRFGLAKFYEGLGQNEKAQDVYQKIIDKDGTGVHGLSARTKLALLLAREKKTPEAEKLIAEVLKENPGDNDALILRGELALTKKDALSAIADFRSVLKDQPTSPKLLSLLAKAHQMNNEPDLAKEYLQKAVDENAQNLQSRLELAQYLAQTGKADDAIEQLKEAVKLSPRNAGVLAALAKLQLTQGQWDAALDTAVKLKTAFPDQAMGYYLSGLADQGKKELGRSEQEFDAALQKSPNAVEPLSALVRSYLAQKEPDKALARLNQVIEQSPKNFVAYNLKGEVLLLKRQFPEAVAAFEKVIEIQPSMLTVYRNLALARQAQGDSAGAVQAYQNGLKANPDNVALMFGLAVTYEALGRYDEAISEYQKVLDKDPAQLAVANNLAMLLVSHKGDQGSLDKAAELVKRLEGADNAAFLDTVGWVRYRTGDLDKAIASLEKAVAKAPTAPEMQYHLGMVYYAKGDKVSARTHLEKAMASGQKFPGMDDAEATLKKLGEG